MKLSKITPLFRIILILVLLILIPIVAYTVFQIDRMNESEMLIRDIYERQLNGILFSINQYCWDIATNWSVEIKEGFSKTKSHTTNRSEIEKTLTALLQTNLALETVLFYQLQTGNLFIRNRNDTSNSVSPQSIHALIKSNPAKIQQLKNQAAKGYSRILSLTQAQDTSGTLLIFVLPGASNARQSDWLGGMIVNPDYLGKEILQQKFDELRTGDFIFAVQNSRTGHFILSPDSVQTLKFEHEKSLWLFPELNLLLRMKGTTISAIVQSRSRANLLLLVGLNTMLFLGLFVVLFFIAREMQLSKLKSDFVSNVSHELRTPLALIRMFAETLEMGRVPNEKKKLQYYQIIANESNRLTRMINNILDFSRIEAGRKSFQPLPTDLSLLTREVLNSYRYHLQKQNFTIAEKIEDSLPKINIDSEAISQALINLLENAVKYSKTTKSISVSLTQKQQTLVLAVKDKGIGIDKNFHKKIFEKFYRASDSLVHDTKGSGLGLTLVKHIMDYHQGEIRVESLLEKGSTFSLIFPLEKEENNR